MNLRTIYQNLLQFPEKRLQPAGLLKIILIYRYLLVGTTQLQLYLLTKTLNRRNKYQTKICESYS